MKAIYCSLVLVAACLCAPRVFVGSAAAQEEGFETLFNGKDLDGWDGDPRLWKVTDGIIHGETTEANSANGNTFLIWQGGDVADFDLRLSFRCNATNNSGIQYRSKHITEKPRNKWVVRGYQHEVRNENTVPNVPSFIYDEGGKRKRICLAGEKAEWNEDGKKTIETFMDADAIKSLVKIDDWNDVQIVAKGNHIQHYLNGKLILDFTDNHPTLALSEGVIALQLHAGKPMWAEFKNIRLKKLGKPDAAAGASHGSAHGSAEKDVVFNDSFTDGDRSNTDGDEHDTEWYTSNSSGGIEASTGKLGLVTGSAGRGIHTIFPAKKLHSVGDQFEVEFTFTTPATLGTDKGAAFRVGLFDSLGREGLKSDLKVSSTTPNPDYKGLPGYLMDMDVGTGSADLNFRKHSAETSTGRLLSTTEGFTPFDETGSDGDYAFEPNKTYTGSIKVKRTSETQVSLTGALGDSSHSVSDASDSTNFDMLVFHANGGAFGSSRVAGEPDNGIDFTNVKVKFTAAAH